MLLTRAIMQGAPNALRMAKSLLTNPTLISMTPPWTISLEVESYAKQGSAEVSQCPVIVPGTGVRQILSDNVAPRPKQWRLSGYIPGDSLAEPTNLFTPVVTVNTAFLWGAFERGSRVIFKDMDMVPYKHCVISDLETRFEKDCKNKMPFSMTIQEIVEIDTNTSELTETERAALPAGEDIEMGTTNATKTEKLTSTLRSLADTIRGK